MARELPHASTIEGLRFTLQVVLPNVIQGIFRRGPRAVTIATKLDIDGQTVGLLEGLRRRHGRGPLWIRVVKDQALLLLSPEDVRRVLEQSPRPFAADPDAKRRGMSHFQPDALTISRGEVWENRRRFTEAVLDTGKPLHRLADRFRTVTGEEAAALLRDVESRAQGKLEFDPFNRAVRRITRRVLLGDAAMHDEKVSELLATLMEEANRLPKEKSEHFAPFMEKVRQYVAAAEPGSVAGLFPEAPSDDRTRVEGQVVHWLFALGDTMPANAFRALALIATHPRQREKVEQELASADGGAGLATAEGIAGLSYLEGCLEEALRLWPTTVMLSRETLEDVDWNGAVVPAGTQIFIVNTFNHRDRETYTFADRFAPEEWTDGSAGDDWFFNHFSHGPQGCPGAGIALFIGKALLADLLTQRSFRLLEPSLNPDKPLPHMFDYYRTRFAVEPKAGGGRAAEQAAPGAVGPR